MDQELLFSECLGNQYAALCEALWFYTIFACSVAHFK